MCGIQSTPTHCSSCCSSFRWHRWRYIHSTYVEWLVYALIKLVILHLNQLIVHHDCNKSEEEEEQEEEKEEEEKEKEEEKENEEEKEQ